MIYGGVEAGGTKFICAAGTGPADVRAVTQFPTTHPEETIGRVTAFFESLEEPVAALGIGSFGPVDLAPASPTYGYITSTPKEGWRNTDLRGAIERVLQVPVAFDTDVNAAALAEHRWGAAQDVSSLLYLTVGTGIGGGAFLGGQCVHGLVHPEMGHLLLPRHPEDAFEGICPFHGGCLEGLAAGPAIEARWGAPAHTLAPDHQAWTFEAYYLALALVNYICVLSPERIVLGGGVMQQEHLYPKIRRHVQQLFNGYVRAEALLSAIDGYIVAPALGDRAGVLGALALAQAHAEALDA